MTPEEKIEAIKKVVEKIENYGHQIDSWTSYISVQFALEDYVNELNEIIEQ